ncbi:S1 RNA-binding domain-containing protein [uncultured Negativibacillus sp.]|uniref:S1 RNA-binding domain-containing protein n=1 Tax=uncultured Negativibacillus sp. TaxID=1980696 RepID=UPI0025FBC5C5|nr:S1 RNA-binding domain-containing protein [uncultured Negativibacillus sp.]
MNNYWPEGLLLHTAQNRSLTQSAAGLHEALYSQTVLEGRVSVCTREHDLLVDFGFCTGRIPRCEGALGVLEGTVRDIALLSRVGKPVCFVVDNILQNPDGSITPILSRRRAQQLCCDNYIRHLRPGDVIAARVTHLEAFGCFVDIGCGICSMIPIDCISISRISHPSDRFCTGQDIHAVVTGIDQNLRVSLSHKELLGSWEQNAAQFCAGETVSAIIRSVESYGIFAELTPNLAGLAEVRPGVRAGQQASVYIKSLIPEKMKVKLILIDAFDAPSHPQPMQYFIDSGHIDHWVYSPVQSPRKIETFFAPSLSETAE